MSARAGTLAADEIAVGGRHTALAGRNRVAVDRETHRAAGLAPFEAGLEKDAVQPLGLGLPLDVLRARDDPGPHMACHLAALGDLGGVAQVAQPTVGARTDE